jgi:N-terminal domain of oxidoreductase
MTETAERIVLASRPVGEPTLDNFRLEELPIEQPGPGQMLLRTLWLSLDPYMRGRMSDAPSYALNAGVWFRRARLLIGSPDSRVDLARRQAETPLILLSRFLRPALLSQPPHAL